MSAGKYEPVMFPTCISALAYGQATATNMCSGLFSVIFLSNKKLPFRAVERLYFLVHFWT